MGAGKKGVDCPVCRLPAADVVELDTLLSDPLRWPATVWGMFEPPKGALPASFRRFGQMQMGRSWLDAHGHEDISNPALRRHIRWDVPVVATDPHELMERGLIASTGQDQRIVPAEQLDPAAFMRYYNRGIGLGVDALERLDRMVTRAEDAGDPVPLGVLVKLAEIGARLAVSQAQIKAAGKRLEDAEDDDAFRLGATTDEGPGRIGHIRIRRIDGKAIPVADEGPKDREHYNARAREEGGSRL
jgi:hypothetical protein